MATKNIFDLASKKVKGEKPDYVKSLVTDEEKKKILTDMVEVKREYWERLPPFARVAYLKKDGEFSRGGLVKGKPWQNKSGGWTLKLCNVRDDKQGNYMEWVVNFDTIGALYKEINNLVWIETAMIRDATEALQNELRQVKTLLAEQHELRRRAEKRKSVEVRMKPNYS